jgi:hypothetical protein
LLLLSLNISFRSRGCFAICSVRDFDIAAKACFQQVDFLFCDFRACLLNMCPESLFKELSSTIEDVQMKFS